MKKSSPRFTEVVPSLWRTWRHLWPWVRKQRSALLIAFGAMVVSIIFRLLEPWPLKIVFDGVFGTSGAIDPFLARLHDQLGAYGMLLLAAVAIIAFSAFRAIADFFNTLGLARVGNRVLTGVRNELFRHLQRLSLSFHSEARSGDLILRVIRDVSFLKDAAVTAAMPLASSLLLLVAMVAVMLIMDWRLALVALVPMPLLALSAGSLTRKIKAAAKIQRAREGALAASATESIGSIKVVQALSLEERFAESFTAGSQKSGSEDLQVRRLSARLERSVDVVIGVSTALVLSYGGMLVLRSQLTPGDLLVFITYLRRAFNPVQNFAKYTGRLAKAAAAGERVTELLDTLPEVRDLPDATPAPTLRGAVSFDEVTFEYEEGRPVLSAVSFTTSPGEWIALVGPSGSGKSTVTSLILRLYDPQNGRVLLDGRDVRDYTIASVRAQMSIVLQESILFAASVWENIGISRAGATRDEIIEAACLANADELIRRLPRGYDTVLGERGVTLSGGERQRIAIARAALRRAPILILDEPTTGLDEENERLVIEALERLATGRTVFVISHDLTFASRADRIMVLERGILLEEGSHQALIERNGRYAALYRLQSTVVAKFEERVHAGI